MNATAQSTPTETSPQPTNAELLAKLTPAEKAVLERIAQGRSNKDIALERGVGVRTIETHREHVMNKLDIHNVALLTHFALFTNLIRNEYAGH